MRHQVRVSDKLYQSVCRETADRRIRKRVRREESSLHAEVLSCLPDSERAAFRIELDSLPFAHDAVFLPGEDMLRREIEAQKELFRLQMQDLELLESGGIAPRKPEKGEKR